MDKYLIINADDFGMCHSANVAVSDLFTNGGCITSATIMAPCAWAKEAVDFAKANPQLAIGAHLTTTNEWGKYRWKPLSGGKSLMDSEGFMHHESDEFEKAADLKETEAEIIAQVEFFKKLGYEPSHLDNHMGSLYGIETGRVELAQLVITMAGKYGLPFRFPTHFTDAQFENDMLAIHIDKEMVQQFIGGFAQLGQSLGVAMPDYLIPNDWAGPQCDSYENFRDYLYTLYESYEPGVTETYLHPAVESDELKAITGSWQRRVWEYNIMKDPKTKQHIKDCGIKLINYRDLAEMKKA